LAVQVATGHFAVDGLLGGVDHVANRADGDRIRPIGRGIQFLQSGFDELFDGSDVHYETEGRMEALETVFRSATKSPKRRRFNDIKYFEMV
jgi:hypothetical protein